MARSRSVRSMAGTISGRRSRDDDQEADARRDGGRVSRARHGAPRGEGARRRSAPRIPPRRPERDRLRPLRRARRDAVRGAAGRASLAVGGFDRDASPTRLYGLALLAGLPPALLLASSCVAFHYAFDPALGRPLWWHLYSPFSVRALGVVLGHDAGLPGGLPLRALARRDRLAAASGRPALARDAGAADARGAPGRLAARHGARPQGAGRLRPPRPRHRRRPRRQAPAVPDRRRARARARPDPDRQGRQQHRAHAPDLDRVGARARLQGRARVHHGPDARQPRQGVHDRRHQPALGPVQPAARGPHRARRS